MDMDMDIDLDDDTDTDMYTSIADPHLFFVELDPGKNLTADPDADQDP
jgi:hypothetical protein